MNTAVVASQATSLVTDPLINMIERAARDQSIDIDKLERLIAMAERQRATAAEQAFNEAMNAAQSEIEPVRKDCANSQTRSKYASYSALDGDVRPIYVKHGFSLSFNTGDAKKEEDIRVFCSISRGGHTRLYQIDMPADGKGAKGSDVMTKTHATGSGVSYGMRYLLKMIFNISEYDDDGNAASKLPKKNARDIYTKLQREMDELPTLKRLENWSQDVMPLFNSLPADWQDELTERYQRRIVELSPDSHDADGVVWDEAPQDQSKWSTLSPVQQAGIRCNDPVFHRFLTESGHPCHSAVDAAGHVRLICGVTTRALLSSNQEALAKWQSLDGKFIAWKIQPQNLAAVGPAESDTSATTESISDSPPNASRPNTPAGGPLESNARVATPTAGNPSQATDELMVWDRLLGEAAAEGGAALRQQWANVPKHLQAYLAAAKDRRHKPAAAKVDNEKAAAQKR